jgi:hypothetical protein
VCRLGLHPLLIEARRSGAERISGGLPRPMMYGKCSAPCTGVWPCVITVASTHRHRRCANLCRGKELQRLHLTQECCSVVVILLLTRKPRGKPSTRSHEHNTHPFPLQTGNGAACQLLTFTYISTAIQAADAQTILLLLEGLGRPVFSD